MKRVIAFAAISALLALSAACDHQVAGPACHPAPTATPTAVPTAIFTQSVFNCPTAIPTAGICLQSSGMTILHGSGTRVTYTANPSLDHYDVIGAFPVGGWVGSSVYGNQYVIRTAADWAGLVATSENPGGSYPIPFDPGTQMLVVISSTALNCCTAENIQKICTSGAQITVYVQWNGAGAGCVDNAGAGDTFYTESIGVILNKSSLPVLWDNPCGIPPFDCSIAI